MTCTSYKAILPHTFNAFTEAFIAPLRLRLPIIFELLLVLIFNLDLKGKAIARLTVIRTLFKRNAEGVPKSR